MINNLIVFKNNNISSHFSYISNKVLVNNWLFLVLFRSHQKGLSHHFLRFDKAVQNSTICKLV